LQQSFPCPKCGTQIPVGQYFCSTCGQRFEYRCRHCGNAIANSSGFCTSCGGKLSNLPQHTQPIPKKAEQTYHRQAAKVERPARQIGRYLVVVAIIFFIVGIIFAIGTSTQGASSNWLGGFTFGGQSPPSTAPVTDSTNGQQKQKSVSDAPTYTVNQIIAAAKKLSPECRLQSRRTG
jgi:hypothetical protein